MNKRIVTLAQLLAIVPSPEQQLLGPIMTAKSIGMIAGPRGGGKSFLALLIAYAVAGKKTLKPWGQGYGAEVAYLDGEMRFRGLRERLQLLHAFNGDPESVELVGKNLHVISRDLCGDPIGSIDCEEGQRRIEENIPSSVKLIIIDNLSAWTAGGREDGTAWAVIKGWLVALRLRGIAVLLVHHAGKNGQQRGSSAHEDLLDYSILLRPLDDEPRLDGTRFSIHHTKLRDHAPALKQDYEFTLWTEDDRLAFEVNPTATPLSALVQEICSLYKDGNGLSQIEIAKALGVNKSTVSRAIKKLDKNELAAQ